MADGSDIADSVLYLWWLLSRYTPYYVCFKIFTESSSAATFGTGTNGAYVEDIAKITKLQNSTSAAPSGKMVINTEWGAFNNTVGSRESFKLHYILIAIQRTLLPSTVYDNKLDRESVNPRSQAFEKLTSGMYLGEITRNIITFLIDQNPPTLFKGSSTESFNFAYHFDAQSMAIIEGAKSLQDVREVLIRDLGLESDVLSDQDAEIVRWVCEQVGTRAAKLCGCAVAALLIQGGYARPGVSSSNKEKLLVAADGKYVCPGTC